MFPDVYLERMMLDGVRLSVYAAIDMDGTPYWSVAGECYGMEMKFNGYDGETSLDQLKQLRKLVDGAITHIKDYNKNNVKKGKNDDADKN